jgi:ectoine hydroxylase-related dioxygenase (phytanoyl-CoA dioxygenase family)
MRLADRAKGVLRRGGLDGSRRNSFLADGYLLLEGYLDADSCESIVAEAEDFYGRQGVSAERADRTMNFHQESRTAKRVLRDPELAKLLSDLLGGRSVFLQSIYFNRGSQQQSHTDYMYMGTDPALQLCGIWLACEDVTPESGPLVYYPGSHRLPSETVEERYRRRMPELEKEIESNRDALEAFYGDRVALTGESLEVCVFFDEWLGELAARLEHDGFDRVTFLPRKGDLLIWHANLVHGGSPVSDPAATRRSLVGHYLTKSVRRYFDMNYVDTRAHLTLRSIDHNRPAVLQAR